MSHQLCFHDIPSNMCLVCRTPKTSSFMCKHGITREYCVCCGENKRVLSKHRPVSRLNVNGVCRKLF